MNFDIHAWLTEPLKSGEPRHKRICYLVTANGGAKVHQWGILTWRNGHQQGLEQQEAIELMQWSAFLDGLEAAGIDVLTAFKPYIDAYQAQFEPPPPPPDPAQGAAP